MKRVFLMIIPALVCGVAFTSCNTEKAEPEVKAAGELYVIGAKSASVLKAGDKTDLVFTGDDMISFNVSSGEIVFAEATKDEIIFRVSHHSVLQFFIDSKPVFDPPIGIYLGWGLLGDADLQFRISDYGNIYLTNAYQHFDSLLVIDREILEIEFEANKQKRQKELDIFIEYLSNSGKIVEWETGLPEVKSNGCDILYFADSLKIENRTINWAINDTRITGLYPVGTDLSDISPIVIVSDWASVHPQSGEKTDFSNEKEVIYTVTAEDGTKKIYKAQAKLE